MNINSSNVIHLHTPVEEVRLCEVKSNAISTKSTTFKFRDADLQPYFTTWCIQVSHLSSTFASTSVGTRKITYHVPKAATSCMQKSPLPWVQVFNICHQVLKTVNSKFQQPRILSLLVAWNTLAIRNYYCKTYSLHTEVSTLSLNISLLIKLNYFNY
jgi:hypothetical protein